MRSTSMTTDTRSILSTPPMAVPQRTVPSSYRKPPPTIGSLRGPLTANTRSSHRPVEGKNNPQPPVPRIVVRVATEDGGYAKPASVPTSRSTSVDAKQSRLSNSMPNVAYNTQGRTKGTRRSFALSSPDHETEGVICTRLCQSPEARVPELEERKVGESSELSKRGKGKESPKEPNQTVSCPSSTAELPLRCDVQPEAIRRDDIPISSRRYGGADTPCHTQSPASTRPSGRSPGTKRVGSAQEETHGSPRARISSKVAAVRQSPVEVGQQNASSSRENSSQAPRTRVNDRPQTPPRVPAPSSPDFLAVPIHSPPGSQRRRAYPDSIDSRHNATASSTYSSHPSPFSYRSAHHTSHTSVSSAKCPDWISPPPPSPIFTPPSSAFTTPSSPIKSPSLRRRVCASLARSDPSLLTAREVREAKEGMSFSIPTREERESGKAGGRVDPVNGCYVEAYDPERPPSAGRVVREVRVPEPLQTSLPVESASFSEGEGETSIHTAATPEPDSTRFPSLSKDSPQYVQRRRHWLRRKTKRMQVDRKSPGWPLVDMQHWDMKEASMMTEEDHRERDQRIADHVPCVEETEVDDRELEERVMPKRRLYVVNPDETVTTSREERQGATANTTRATQEEERPIDESMNQKQPKGASSSVTTSRNGSCIDQMTMRGLFKLLEHKLKASQKECRSGGHAG